MRSIEIAAGKEMLILDLPDLLNLANVDRDDSGWVQDQKISAYLNRRPSRTIERDPETFQQQVAQAIQDGIQVLIVKEKSNEQS